MSIRHLGHCVGRALNDLWVNRLAAALSVVVSTACFLILGVAFLLFWNGRQMIPAWVMDSRVVVTLQPQTTPQDQEDLTRELEGWSEIDTIITVSREEARGRLERQLGEWKGMLEGVQESVLPPSIELTLKPAAASAGQLGALAEKLGSYRQVEEILYGRPWSDRWKLSLDHLKHLGAALIGLLGLGVVMVVVNMTRLSAASRGDELELYSIFGATPLFIRLPFYLTGMSLGTASAALAAVLLSAFVLGIGKVLPVPLTMALSWERSGMFLPAMGLLLCGVLLGAMGSWLGLKRSLRN